MILSTLNQSVKNTKWDYIISVVWLFLLLCPTSTAFYMSIPILLLLLYDRGHINNKIILPLFFLLNLTFVFSAFNSFMDTKAILRLMTLGLIFFTFASLRGNKIFFSCVLFASAFVLLSQVSIMYNIPFLAASFDNVYNISYLAMEAYHTDLGAVTYAEIVEGTRLGGIFVNPNVCASYMSVIYATGLCEAYQLGGKNKILYLFVAIVALSIIITGSRTALIVFALVSFNYLKSHGFSIKLYLLIAAIIGLLFVLINIDSLRIFKIKEGFETSVGMKMDILFRYIQACDNPIYFIFGAGDISVTTEVLPNTSFSGTDCDLGNIFLVFGIVFYFCYIYFYCKLYKAYNPVNRYILWVLLWSVSNSILISYRMAPLWFLTIGIVYRRSILERNRKKEIT